MAGTEGSGLSAAGLTRLSEVFQRQVDQRRIPGAVVLIGRAGRIVFHEAYGFRDREAGSVMPLDGIFRLSSMTKPLVALGAMMLVEEGRLRLDAAVGEFLPMLKDMKVAVPAPDGTLKLAPPARPPMILDLLRHTSGIVNGHLGTSAVKRLYAGAGILPSGTHSRAEYLRALGEQPLEFEPGSTFAYGASMDVVGHIIEEVSGLELDSFMRRRVTEPLGMPDTVFQASPSCSSRIAEPQVDVATGKRPAMRDPTLKPARLSGSGNMVSSARDWARFCDVLLGAGKVDGKRIVSRKTIDLVTVDQLPPAAAFDPENASAWGPALPSPVFGHGFGLGFAVRTHAGRATWHGSVGDFCWVGSTGVLFWVDPAEDLFAIMFTQSPTELVPNLYVMRSIIYGALADEGR